MSTVLGPIVLFPGEYQLDAHNEIYGNPSRMSAIQFSGERNKCIFNIRIGPRASCPSHGHERLCGKEENLTKTVTPRWHDPQHSARCVRNETIRQIDLVICG